MRHLKLLPATIDSERQVVEEEKRLRVDNDPVGKAIEKFRALAYTKHPYNWTAIGTIEDLEKVTPEPTASASTTPTTSPTTRR